MERTKTSQSAPQPLTADEERRLIVRAQGGEVEAFERLMIAYQDSVYGLAWKLMGNYDDAHDLAQEVFVVLHRKIGQFRGESRLRTWLYRIVVNRAKNYWKKRERRGWSRNVSLDQGKNPDEEPAAPEPAETAPGPRRTAAGRETLGVLMQALEHINPEQREALTLRCMEDMSYEEIADILDCSLGTVKSRINRGRNELRRLMADYI